MKIVIIGSGFAGLGAAALLAKAGHQVSVYEKNSQPGGRAMVFERDGFKFDMGPSWYLMPDVFENFFAEFGKKPADFLDLVRLDPNYRIFYGANDYVDIFKDAEANRELFEQLEPGSYKKFEKYLTLSKYKYITALKEFVYNNYNSIFDLIKFRYAFQALRLDLFTSIDKYISKFFKSDRLKKILEYNVVFLGGSPDNTPALFSIMAHVDFNLGVFYPQGGIGEVIKAIAEVGKSQGVEFHYNSPVEEIVVKDGKAKGVKVGGEFIEADIVVSGADYHFTETKLLAPEYRTHTDKFWESRTLAPSAFVMYLGVKGKVPNLAHHTLVFANDWQEHFRQIFNDPQWPQDPSYYVCCPSKTDPGVAPAADENLFVLVPIASGLEDTPEIREQYQEMILKHMEKTFSTNLRDRLVVKQIFTLNDYQQVYNSYKGSALGLAHTLGQSALFRPHNRNKKVKSLYYTGQYTLPGIGMPMCLISAQLVRDQIAKYERV